MQEFWKAARLWVFGGIVGLYTTYVLLALWDWFVAPTLHVPEIGYWQMYGFNMLIGMMASRSTFVEEDRWERALVMIHSAIPADKREEIEAALKDKSEHAWKDVGMEIVKKIIQNTLVFAIGLAIHTFLA